MIKIVLIHSWDGEDRNQYFVSPPLGVHRIAKWARAELGDSIDIEVIDPNLFEPAEALDTVATQLWLSQPDVVGFSPLHLTLENDIAMMLTSKIVCPTALFLAGGRQATTDPHTLFSNFDALHTVLKGEAELLFVELMKTLLEHGVNAVNNNPAYFAHIPGLFIRGKKKTIRDTGPNPGLSPFDFRKATWLIDFSEMDLEQYWEILKSQYTEQQLTTHNQLRKIYTIKPITTNFCPMNCSFCDVTSKQRRDIGSALKVVGLRGEELENYITMLLKKHTKVQQILFKDDLWFLRGKGAIRGKSSSPLLYEDLDALKRVRNKFPERNVTFSGKARVDTFVDPATLEVDWALLKATRESGFVSVSMGIESFDNEDLVYFNKRLGIKGPDINRVAIRSITAAGFSSVSYLILANDKSTIGSIFRSVDSIIDLIEESPKHVIKINDFLYPLPGTVLSQQFQNSTRPASSSFETKRFQVPGFPDRYVDRIIKVYPENADARELMIEYEENKHASEQRSKQQLGIKHWISEYSTPTNVRLLYELANKRNLVSEVHANHQILRMTRLLTKLKSLNIENSSATMTDA